MDNNYVEKVIEYIKGKYGIDYEKPWAKYPDNMTFKDKMSDKWFALIMPVNKKKLGLADDEEIYVINVKNEPVFIGMVTKTPGYLPGYHMNKQNWLTIFLDGTVPLEQIYERIDESYDMIVNTPTRRIYEAVKQIPRGKVATYGKIAEMAGNPKMSRAVGNALHKNSDPDNVPCYRVVNSKGELAEAFAFGGENVQEKLLKADGIEVIDGKVDLAKYGI